jgi:hypothetical protein
MPVKINLLQVTSTIQDGDQEAPQVSTLQFDEKLAEMEQRILKECMMMILEALEKQEER